MDRIPLLITPGISRTRARDFDEGPICYVIVEQFDPRSVNFVVVFVKVTTHQIKVSTHEDWMPACRHLSRQLGQESRCGAPTRLLYSDAVCHRLSDPTGGYGFTNTWPKPLAGVARN